MRFSTFLRVLICAVIIAGFDLAFALSPPPAPVVHILQPGDNLPQYDGDLDRVEIRAVPGSHVWVTKTWWPNDGLHYVAFGFRQRGEYHLKMAHPFIVDGAPVTLWTGIGWTRFTRFISYRQPDDPNGPFMWPERTIWPPEEWHDDLINGQWYFPTNPVHLTTWTNGWEDYFEGTGEIALDWGDGYRGIPLWRPAAGEHREPPTISADENIEIEVTFYPL